MIQSGLRHAKVVPATQAGEGGWIMNSSPFGIRSRSHFVAIGPQEVHVVKPKKPFICPGNLPGQIKNYFLCVLGASAVKFYFGQE